MLDGGRHLQSNALFVGQHAFAANIISTNLIKSKLEDSRLDCHITTTVFSETDRLVIVHSDNTDTVLSSLFKIWNYCLTRLQDKEHPAANRNHLLWGFYDSDGLIRLFLCFRRCTLLRWPRPCLCCSHSCAPRSTRLSQACKHSIQTNASSAFDFLYIYIHTAPELQ